MGQINLNDPNFGIKIIPAEEAISKIPREILITKIVDLYRRTHGKEPLLKSEGGWTEAGAKLTMEEIKKEFEEIPRKESSHGAVLLFGESPIHSGLDNLTGLKSYDRTNQKRN